MPIAEQCITASQNNRHPCLQRSEDEPPCLRNRCPKQKGMKLHLLQQAGKDARALPPSVLLSHSEASSKSNTAM